MHAAVTGGCTEALVQPDLSRGASFTYMRWDTVGVTEKKRYHFQSISVFKQPPPPKKEGKSNAFLTDKVDSDTQTHPQRLHKCSRCDLVFYDLCGCYTVKAESVD